MRIGSKDRLSQAILDHVTHHQFRNIFLNLNIDLQVDALPYCSKLGHITLFIQQVHFSNGYLTGAGNSLRFAVVFDLFNRLILLISQQRIVVIHDGFRLAFHFNAAFIQQNGAIADALYRLLIMGYQQ